MDDRPTKRAGPLYWLRRRSRRFWIIAVAMLPVLYVASFGPMHAWMQNYSHELWAWHIFNYFYSPVDWMLDHSPKWINDMMVSYLDWLLKNI